MRSEILSRTRCLSHDRPRLDDKLKDEVRTLSASAGKIHGDATSNYRPSAGVVRGRVYRFNRVGREKYPRHVGTTASAGREGVGTRVVRVPRGIFFFSRVPRRQKNVEHKLSLVAIPACRAPVGRPAVDAGPSNGGRL